MCLMVASTEHPQYPIIILSNRDEYFGRPTALASYTEIRPGVMLVAPYDLARPEHGTWIGITTTGRFAVLLNYTDPGGSVKVGSLSRGMIPLHFLKSELSPSEWQHEFHIEHAKELQNVGGFTLVYGDLSPSNGQVASEGLHIMSNRGKGGKILDRKTEKRTFAVSNSLYTEPWPKVKLAEHMLHEAINTAGTSTAASDSNSSLDRLIECGIKVLSHNTYGIPTSQVDVGKVRETIFVPPLESAPLANANQINMGKFYGTRTQTIIVADKNGRIHYIERDIHNSDLIKNTDEISQKHLSFQIDCPSVITHAALF